MAFKNAKSTTYTVLVLYTRRSLDADTATEVRCRAVASRSCRAVARVPDAGSMLPTAAAADRSGIVDAATRYLTTAHFSSDTDACRRSAWRVQLPVVWVFELVDAVG